MNANDYIQWQPEFMTGIEKIDEGHLQFIKIHNQLVDIMNKDFCRQKIVELLYALMHYAEHHLINEEIYYQGYDGFAEHKVNHQKFIEKINQTQSYLANDSSPEACDELLAFLKSWFKNHILEKDKAAVDYVKSIQK
ncbi:MAG TPA: bacteriohemerythrin [Salinivirga sp.]|uniref:bacteriohemerythrin n=1 Tax=Salinivirga sp. TaxID=1970192 RepID=UPI002B48741C|nr:bacteriohemerythrin [Salinivirga sp.]HKK59121.1 bacteriohemerythrin [Salinivirga sp.]